MILGALWYTFPLVIAGALHMAVVKMDVLKPLRVPLDAGATWRGHRIFGDHKTWRGVLVMVALAALGMMLQSWLSTHFPSIARIGLLDYTRINAPLAGAILGLGYALGELPNSFLKRQLNITPGVTHNYAFMLLDQADSVIGCLLLSPLFWHPSLSQAGMILAVGTGLHLFLNASLFLVGLRKRL